MSGPRITIAMPIYNAGRYLRPALHSMLQQTERDWELLLIDDGSTDKACESVADLLGDPRVRVVRDGGNKGLAARLNEAIDLARGEYIARMDQDDLSFPERLEKQLAYLQAYPEVDLLACRSVRISFDDELVGRIPFASTHEALCAKPWRGIHMAHPSWMGRTAWFRKHRYAQPGPYFCEDQELLLRAAAQSRYASLPELLFAYRVRGSLPWRKTLRTRKVLLGIRVRHFWRQGDLGALGMSVIAFVATVLRDAWQAFARCAPHDNGLGDDAADAQSRFAALLVAVGIERG